MNRVRFLSKVVLAASFVFAMAFTFSCGGSGPKRSDLAYRSESGNPVYFGKLTYEGETYRTIEMPDGKIWMAQNLKYVTKDSKCQPDVKDGVSGYCSLFGQYYTWDDAMKVCPAGWHLPTKEEWNTMVAAIGGKEVEGKILKSNSSDGLFGWTSYSEDPNFPVGAFIKNKDGSLTVVLGKSGAGEDKYGFRAIPNGHGTPDGNFVHIGKLAIWWLASEADTDSAYFSVLFNISDEQIQESRRKKLEAGKPLFEEKEAKTLLLSVRCVQGDAPKPTAKIEIPTAVEASNVETPTVEDN